MEISQLTFLRFIAASAVVVFHFGREVPSLSWGAAFWPYANTAVSFFFVLSGFILAHVYGTKGVRSRRDFYVARFARIAPLYWAALLVVVAYAIYKHSLDGTAALLNATLLQAWVPGYALTLNSPGWSLSVEVFFYLLFPWLLRNIQRVRRPWLLAVVMLLVWGGNLALHVALMSHPDFQSLPAGHEFTAYSPVTHVATFTIGVIGGVLFDAHRKVFQRMAVPLMVISVLGLMLLFVWPNPFVRFHHNGLLSPLYLMLLWGLGAAEDSQLKRLLSMRPMVLLGEASYGVYILQFPVGIIHAPMATRLHWGVEATFWTYFLLLVVVSLASFVWVERPLRMRIKAVFSGPLTSSPRASTI